MFVGYARVSTQDQKLELQRDALTSAGCEKTFEDKASGVKAARPGLAEAIAFMRPGDTLVIWKLSRLGRSLKQLIEAVQNLQDKGIELKSLHESIDTNTATGSPGLALRWSLSCLVAALICTPSLTVGPSLSLVNVVANLESKTGYPSASKATFVFE